MSKFPIIVFEGIEGSGKTTHINLVNKYLKKKNKKFIKFREPGGSKNAEKIRKILLNNKSNFNKKTDLLLMFGSRSENIEKIINQNYKKKIIIIDRFIDSTIAYQHYGMGIDIKIIKNINNFLLNRIKPDFTFLNVVNKKNLILRLKKRKNKNRYDKFSRSFYNNAQKAFIKLAKNSRSKYYIFDNSTDDKSLEDKILKVVLSKIK